MTEINSPPAARVAASALYVIVWPALLLVLGGDARWLEGWLFSGWLVGVYATVTVWMHVNDPALMAERRRSASKSPGRAEQQDRRLVLLLFLGFVVWIVLMPLDARRFGWAPPLPWPVRASGAAVLLLSAFFLFRAFHDNTFLSGVTRVQSERKQHVVTTGVYAFVRHPMYLGMVLMFTGAPLLLGSGAGLVVAAALTLLLAFRITREERLLGDELEGYEDYRRQVRYRLVPRVW